VEKSVKGTPMKKTSSDSGPTKATQDNGKVRLGDMAPVFATPAPKKVTQDAATKDGGKVRMGDMAPIF
jgi:hypothetical protein